jgi:hypothetical protein
LPVEGKDGEYDAIMEEIRALEGSLEKELGKMEKKVG